MTHWEEILSEKSFMISFSSTSKNTYWGGTVVIVLHCKPYVITASSRHLVASMQVPITARSLCNTQRRARKTLWQYAASKRMHLFIHRFIYVHISLRADIIQITKFRKWATSRVLSSFLPESGWYLVSINLLSCLFTFVKSPSSADIAQNRFYANRLSQSRQYTTWWRKY